LKFESVRRGKAMAHPKPVEEPQLLVNHLDLTEVRVHRHHVPPYMDQYHYCTELHKELPNEGKRPA
jgi:hypothetical protein